MMPNTAISTRMVTSIWAMLRMTMPSYTLLVCSAITLSRIRYVSIQSVPWTGS